jgi:catechol 2,3-dioxygenase
MNAPEEAPMGTSDDAARPATHGSYGRPPRGYRLPHATRLGPVRLQVADLDRSLAFYAGVLGLRVAERGEARASLAADRDERVLIELRARPGAAAAGRPARLGLYHVALLLPDRAALGRLVAHLAAAGVRLGAGDHLVSEAFYLNDPDGLGIEVYADRPRSDWRRRGDELIMATDPVDVEAVVAAALGVAWTGMPAGTAVGHVHLHVGSIEEAVGFYVDAVGFDRMVWSYPGALFLGAGGYHHHLGTNTWAGPAARPARDGDARLLAWTLELPSAHDVAALASSLEAAGRAATIEGGELLTEDPWGTRLRVRVAP